MFQTLVYFITCSELLLNWWRCRITTRQIIRVRNGPSKWRREGVQWILKLNGWFRFVSVMSFTEHCILRDWTNSVLPNPCGGDAITCLCGLFCIPCLTCSNARHLGQSGLVYCLLSCFCNPIAAFLLRQKAREKFWIDGSDCEDFVSWCQRNL